MIIGIDVSKNKMDIAILTDKIVYLSYENNKNGLKKLLDKLVSSKQKVTMVALEFTGGYEKLIVKTLVSAGYPVHITAGKNIYYFAKMKGYLAKTDKLDCMIIAEYAKFNNVIANSKDYLQDIELRELQSRQSQLKDIIANEKKRLDKLFFSKKVTLSMRRNIKHLEKEMAIIEKEITELLQSDQQKQATIERLQTVKGVGINLAKTLVIYLPELGKRSRAEIAALAGVAPINKDSGKKQGYRKTYGGRAVIKKALYMAALSASRYNSVLKQYYQRLIAKGKKAKVAIMAVMRKLLICLNTMQSKQENWQYEPAANLNGNG